LKNLIPRSKLTLFQDQPKIAHFQTSTTARLEHLTSLYESIKKEKEARMSLNALYNFNGGMGWFLFV